MDGLELLIAASLNAGTALAIAGIGLLINERAGILNLGAEGLMLVAAIAGFAVAVRTGNTWLAFGVGMAGLAGGLEAAGPLGQLTLYVPAGYGFAAIIVAYVGRLHPVGIVFSGFLMSLFYIGGELAQSRLGLPKALTGVFQGLLLFTLLACDTLIYYRVRWRSAPGAAAAPRAVAATAGTANEGA